MAELHSLATNSVQVVSHFQYVSSLLCEQNLLSSLTVCEHNSLDLFVFSFFAFLRAGLNFSPSRLLLKPVLYTNVIMAGSLFPSSSIPPTITVDH